MDALQEARTLPPVLVKKGLICHWDRTAETRGEQGTARGSGVYYPELLTFAGIKKREGSYRTNKSSAGDRVQEPGMKREMSGRNT